MIYGLFVLFAFQALGELIKIVTGTVLPGAVIGLLLLFLLLLVRRGVPPLIGETSARLIGLLPLLLTPPSVGMFFLSEQMQGKGYAVAFAVIAGTIFTLVFSGVLMAWLIRLSGKDKLS